MLLYQKNERNKFIDIFKVFAIFLVVLGHTPLCNNVIKQLIYSFHMPAFFAVYGLTYNIEKHSQCRFFNLKFTVSKFKRLLMPCFLWGLIYSSLSLKNVVYILWGSQMAFKRADALTSLWFLPCMFIAVCITEVLMYIIHKLCRKSIIQNIAVICFIVIFSLTAYIFPKIEIGYPWSINVAFMACAFILSGYILQKIIICIKKFNEGVLGVWGIVTIISFIILIVTFRKNLQYIPLNNVDMASGNYGNYFLFMLDSIMGIIMLISVAVLFGKIRINKFWIFAGSNTLAVFVLHKPIVVGISNVLTIYRFNYWIYSIPISIAVLLFCYALAYVINAFLPELIGNKPRKK